MGTMQGKKTVFSIHLCIGGQHHSEPTKAFPKQNPEMAMLSTSPYPTPLLKQNLSPEVIAGSGVTR